MVISVIFALLLLCFGISIVFAIYIWLLWYTANRNAFLFPSPEKRLSERGLSVSELEKVPKITGSDKLSGRECAVCLDEIERNQPARLLPVCNHGFHVQCADAWLSKHPVCPICRAKLDPQLLNPQALNPNESIR